MADPLAAWVAELSAALGLDAADVDRALLLDVARDAAHAVARPAAPLSTFLLGYAAGLRGGGPDVIRAVAEQVRERARQHAADSSQ